MREDEAVQTFKARMPLMSSTAIPAAGGIDVHAGVLGDDPNNAIRFAGVLLGLAGLTMLWIKEPPMVRDVDEVSYMPSAAH